MNIFLEMFLGAFSGQTHVKIFCFKSLNYYLKMHKMVKFPLGGIMLLRESLEEIDDFRVKRCRKFELADIFLLVLFGLLSGIKDIEHIAEWAEKSRCEMQRMEGEIRACALRWRFMGFENSPSPNNPFIRVVRILRISG